MNPNFTVFGSDENWGKMGDVMEKMMRSYTSGPGWYFWQIRWLFELVIWVLLMALLVAATRYFWKKGNK